MQTQIEQTMMDQAALVPDANGSGETQSNFKPNEPPAPFRVPSHSAAECGSGLNSLLHLAQAFWAIATAPEVAAKLCSEIEMADGGGLQLRFEVCGTCLGNVAVTETEFVYSVKANTVLDSLEHTTSPAFEVYSMGEAIAWVRQLVARLCDINQVWDPQMVDHAAMSRDKA